jgi:hypothetical protein
MALTTQSGFPTKQRGFVARLTDIHLSFTLAINMSNRILRHTDTLGETVLKHESRIARMPDSYGEVEIDLLYDFVTHMAEL